MAVIILNNVDNARSPFSPPRTSISQLPLPLHTITVPLGGLECVQPAGLPAGEKRPLSFLTPIYRG